MQFPIAIPIAGGGSNDPSPRTDPSAVPDHLVGTISGHIPSSTGAPRALVLALEGTATQTATVQVWVQEEQTLAQTQFNDDPNTAKAARRFYAYGDPITLTVGSAQPLLTTVDANTGLIQLAPCPVGRVYFQITSKPAAAATLKVGWLGG